MRLEIAVAGFLSAALALTATPLAAQTPPPVQVVLFTHIEDNTPAGALGAAENRQAYLTLRARLLAMGALAKLHGVRWSLQPDWKILLAAAQYEDTQVMSSTAGMNVFRYLRDVLGAAVDPHSHENGGFNYTDVAYLLQSMGVGGSTVIGGHIWDPALPQFQQWDRFREPVRGQRYPEALWRGDILMGSGTPNHVNDPVLSGVWRPRDRADYFADDPSGNIAAVGAWLGGVDGVVQLVDAHRSGQVGADCMLTASIGIRPLDLAAANGLQVIESTVVLPLASLRDQGRVVLTDFTALVATWRTQFGARACLYGTPPR